MIHTLKMKQANDCHRAENPAVFNRLVEGRDGAFVENHRAPREALL